MRPYLYLSDLVPLHRAWALAVAGLASLACAQGLPPEVTRALERAQLPPTALHVVVAPAQGGPERLSLQADRPVNPASLMKLVTTSAALDLLGPAYVWRTTLWSDGPLVQGVLRGNLYVQGQGDPKLVVERLWLLLRRLKALGIDRIEGDLVLDRSAFDVTPVDPGQFDGEPTRPYNASPDALIVNYKSLLLHWVPDRAQGVARLHVEPPMAGLRAPSSVPLQKIPCTDYRGNLQADFSKPDQLQFKGAYPQDCGERVWPVAYAEPGAHAGRAIQGMWATLGGLGLSRVRDGRVPAQAQKLLESESPTLGEVVRDINKFSNNLMADQLFLTLSFQVGGVGRFEDSRAWVQRWWAQRVGVSGLNLDNGSGLSRSHRVTAQGLAVLLQHAYASPYMAELMASLPILGQDGTLRRAQSETRAHLKTGSLRNVLGIAGYVDGAAGQRWVLVAIIEHPQAQSGRPVLQALADWAGKP
jgi:serine-type D-Ala-D-Ala carboxypeptidase/endopeptidase (penicillin-binding protein 4)